jgi:hypothetical protein
MIKEWEYRQARLYGQITFDNLEKEAERIRELDRKYSPKIENAVKSMNRSKNNLMDLLKCNDFVFFVTLTFDDKKIDSYNDVETRTAFKKWAKNVRERIPEMTYIAIEEYQKRGALHYHLLVGDVTAEKLGLKDSGRKVKKGRCKGQTIYNVTKWEKGFSTATEIFDNEAVKYYLSKYLTKGKIDPRFFGKKRYFTSRNINRPAVEKFKFPCDEENNIFDSVIKEDYNIDYEDKKKEYTVLSRKIN